MIDKGGKMKNYLDARGKQCPIPVIETIKLLSGLKTGEIASVSVDNEIAVQNLKKMAEQKNLEFSSEQKDADDFLVKIVSNGESESTETDSVGFDADTVNNKNKTIVVLSSEYMGTGNDELGKILIKGFLYALRNLEELPFAVIMYNGGAKLSVNDSEVLQDLIALEEAGVKIMTCGTCLDYYNIKERLAVGEIVNMYRICQYLSETEKVIKP